MRQLSKFVHLHVHNEYSVLDGVGTSKQYAELALELGQTHLAISNHGNIDGAIDHQKQCKAIGIKPLIGCELYVVDDINIKSKGEKRYHLTVIVENQTGWQNLLKMLTIANLEGFYHRPRVDFEVLRNHLEGLVLLTGCSMSILNRKPGGRLFLHDAIDILGKDRVFLEVQPHQMEYQIAVNKTCFSLKKRYGLKLVGTNDCHYPTNRSARYQEILLAIQSKSTLNDKNRWKFDIDGLYLKSEQEMIDSFAQQKLLSDYDISEAISSTELIAGMCEGFEIKKIEPNLPSIGIEGSDTFKMNELIDLGWNKRLDFDNDELALQYEARIAEEMSLIKNMKFERYFLIVWDLINWCKVNGIMTGPGRGSVGGSLCAYLMGITDVDPIKYDLVFSRFISPDRIDLPDIDMDFEDHKRHLVKKYLQDKYGEFNVAGLSTFGTMKGKGVLRDVSRVYDIPLREVDTAAKSIDDSEDTNQIKTSFASVPECMRFKRKYPEAVECADALEGQIRGCGQHAAAVCVSSTDLRDGVNCNLSIRSGQIVANWDKDNAEFMGLVKLDILGLSALSILNEARAMILKNHGEKIDFDSLKMDDPKVFDEINAGHTVGTFQIGARGLSRFCQDMGIDSFDHIVAATALYRPGPLHSGMAEQFIAIKRGKKKVKKIHKFYDEITQDTYGIIVYQEQVMSVINRLSGIDMASCDKIRKLMAKSKGADAINAYHEKFIQGCIELKTVTGKQAETIWETISTFGKYGFNKAHSVEYSMITYWDMWLKVYYPYEFIACCLTYGGLTNFKEYLKEARRLKLNIRLPKVGFSHAKKWIVDKENNLFAPFGCIDGIGESSAKAISEFNPNKKKKVGFFTNGEIKKTEKIPGVNSTTTALLEKIDAFSPIQDITMEEKRMVREIFNC